MSAIDRSLLKGPFVVMFGALLVACSSAVITAVRVQAVRDNIVGTWKCDLKVDTGTTNMAEAQVVLEVQASTFKLTESIVVPISKQGPFKAGSGTWTYDGSTVRMKYISEGDSGNISDQPTFAWRGIQDPLDKVGVERISNNTPNSDPNADSNFEAVSVKVLSSAHVIANLSQADESGTPHAVKFDCAKQ